METPRRGMRCAGSRRSEWPSNSIAPSVTTWPAIDFSSVLFPAPLAPTTATISPRATRNDTPCNACNPRYEADTSSSRSIAVAEIGTDHVRVAHHIDWCADGQHAAEIQYDGTVDQRQQHFHHVFDHHHRDAAGADVADQLHARRRFDRREPGQHLVEQQQARL